MSKSLIIGLVAAVLVVGGATAFFITQKDADSNSNSSTAEINKENEDKSTKDKNSDSELISTFNKLRDDGKDAKCTYTFKDNNTSVEGVGYFTSNKKARLDYKAVDSGEDGKTINASIIISEDSQTFWDNATKKGFQVSVSKEQSQAAQSGIDTNKDIDFKCEDWDADLSVYVVPDDVEVQDLTKLMDQISPSN